MKVLRKNRAPNQNLRRRRRDNFDEIAENSTSTVRKLLFVLGVCSMAYLNSAALEASDWLSAPQPKFPPSALRKGSEGVVKLRLQLAADGTVRNATILKSSRDSVLDETARVAVLKWKMKPSAVRPSDTSKGRVQEVEFKQEAIMGAAYPLGVRARFDTEEGLKPWMYAPFPDYPVDARRLHHTGTVLLSAIIGNDGEVSAVQLIKTSGYSDLDEQAVKAVRHWRAHRHYAGQTLRFPITFKLGWH